MKMAQQTQTDRFYEIIEAYNKEKYTYCTNDLWNVELRRSS